MEPTHNLSGCHSFPAWTYRKKKKKKSFPAWTFDQEQEEQDTMSSMFMLPESQSPPLSPLLLLLLLSRPPAEGFPGPENSGDWGQIPPLDEMPCIPFGDGQISPLDEVPCIPAAVAEETSYAAAPAPLVATHGTETGQLLYNFSMSSTTFDNLPFCLSSEAEVQQVMMSLQPLVHPQMALDGLWNTTNGGPAARSHADAVPVVQQGTSTTADELPHPQQQLPLLTNNSEAQPGGGWAWLGLSLVDEVQIQQMTPTISLSQLPSPTPVINPGPDEANHAASAPTGSHGTSIPTAPQDQEGNIMSRASTPCRAKSRGLPSQLQDGSGNLFHMVIDMIRQFVQHIGKRQYRSVWQRFWRSHCKYCGTITMICQYCNTVMRNPSTIELLRHLKSCDNNIHLLPALSGASKETHQRSSQALWIKEIAKNSNGESEPIETDNNNCATAAWVDTQGTNTGVILSPWQQHQLPMDREEQMATILSSQPCCQGCSLSMGIAQPNSWWDLVIRLSDSSSTTKSTHDGFRLKFSNNKETGCTIVHVHSSAAWVQVSENLYKYHDHAGVFLRTFSYTIGKSYMMLSVGANDYIWKPAPDWCTYPWRCMLLLLRSLGFRKEFSTDFVIYALGWVDACNLRLRSPRSSDKGKSIVEQGDASSGKRKRKSAPRRWSKVWKHFTEEEVEAEGSMVTMARCNYCPSELKADSAGYGTSHLKRHIRSIHPEHAKSL